MALVASLFAVMFLTCLGMALVLLGTAGTALAAHDRDAAAAARAAHAAIALATGELRARPDWSGLLADGVPSDLCAAPGGFVDVSLLPRAPWDGSILDLPALSLQRQADGDGEAPAGASPVWRLFEYGPISRLIPSESRRYPAYIVVWVADGQGGVVLLHATAFAGGSVRAGVEASLVRRADGTLDRLAIRAAP